MKTRPPHNAARGAIAAAFLAWLPSAHAGMTVYGLRDIYRMRLEEISFFVVLLLGCVFVVKFLWNHAFKDSARVPRLKFTQSLCLTTLLGLSTLLILTMISGIREVLTPEAWRHQGTSYRLNSPAQEPVRRRSLEHLRTALLDYSRSHGGQFPPHDFGAEIGAKLWESPDPAGTRYLYTGGLTTNDIERLLVVEPANFGERRLGLNVSGRIEFLTQADIDAEYQVKPVKP